KIPYHTSIISGWGWVNELLHGHPDRIHSELGVCKHIFYALVDSLECQGLSVSHQGVMVEEQLAIFLYMSVTGLSVRHVGERFQCSNETISQ
ncbi:hypothetical protein K439DRAFT_1338572, partial [Ramaria rubella]